MNDDAIAVAGRRPTTTISRPSRDRAAARQRSHLWVGFGAFTYGTLAAVLFAFILYPSQHVFGNTIDLNGFGVLARNLALGHGFTWGFGPTIRRAPLYPFLGAALLKVFGSGTLHLTDNITYRPILAANCVFFGLTCLMVWALARRLFGPRVAVVAAVLCPLVPQAIRYVGMTEVETIMGLFIVLLVYTGLNLIERPGLVTGGLFGLVAAAATLTKPVTQYFPLLFIVLAWFYWRSRRSSAPATAGARFTRVRAAATAAALACFILPLVPWVIRNMTVTDGQFTGISSEGAGSFLRGYINTEPKYYLLYPGFDNNGAWETDANAYEAGVLHQYGVPFYRYAFDSKGNPSVAPALPKGETGAQTEAQQDRVESRAMKLRLTHQPVAFLKKFLIQCAIFWYLETSRLSSLAVGGIALVVLVLAFLGLLRGRRLGVITWPIVAIVLYLNLVYAFSLALGRYSAPLFPTLLVLAAGGLASLVPRLRMPLLRRRNGAPAV